MAKMEIITFDISGESVTPEAAGLPATIAQKLNDGSDKMASDIEKEIKRMIPPGSGISAQAEMAFAPGSILLTGSVMLLSWAGQTALEPIKEELGGLIKLAVKKVLARTLPGLGVAPMDIDVVPVVTQKAEQAQEEKAPADQPKTPATQSAVGSLITLQQGWFYAAIGLLTVIVLVLLVDRLLSSEDGRKVIMLQQPAATTVTTPSAETRH
jgi:hypothetical protein